MRALIRLTSWGFVALMMVLPPGASARAEQAFSEMSASSRPTLAVQQTNPAPKSCGLTWLSYLGENGDYIGQGATKSVHAGRRPFCGDGRHDYVRPGLRNGPDDGRRSRILRLSVSHPSGEGLQAPPRFSCLVL